MPATSPEAIARKKIRKYARAKERKAENRAAEIAALTALPPRPGTGRKWFRGPPMPEMSKSQLREMFAQAAQNTAQNKPTVL